MTIACSSGSCIFVASESNSHTLFGNANGSTSLMSTPMQTSNQRTSSLRLASTGHGTPALSMTELSASVCFHCKMFFIIKSIIINGEVWFDTGGGKF